MRSVYSGHPFTTATSEIAAALEDVSIPTLLLFKGGKVADQVVGFVPQDAIEEKIQRVLA